MRLPGPVRLTTLSTWATIRAKWRFLFSVQSGSQMASTFLSSRPPWVCLFAFLLISSWRYPHPRSDSRALSRTLLWKVLIPDSQTGTFPLYAVSRFEQKLPAAMVAKGGLFFPMYRKSQKFRILAGLTCFPVPKRGRLCGSTLNRAANLPSRSILVVSMQSLENRWLKP